MDMEKAQYGKKKIDKNYKLFIRKIKREER